MATLIPSMTSAGLIAIPGGLDRDTWRMAPIDQLAPPARTRLRMISLYSLRGYLVVAVMLITLWPDEVKRLHVRRPAVNFGAPTDAWS